MLLLHHLLFSPYFMFLLKLVCLVLSLKRFCIVLDFRDTIKQDLCIYEACLMFCNLLDFAYFLVIFSSHHDELQNNCKNTPLKRNMGFGSYFHVVSPTSFKKIQTVFEQVIRGNFDFWRRAMLKGPKRSFVVVVMWHI